MELENKPIIVISGWPGSSLCLLLVYWLRYADAAHWSPPAPDNSPALKGYQFLLITSTKPLHIYHIGKMIEAYNSVILSKKCLIFKNAQYTLN